jgi:hypothetical protein
MSLCYDFEKWTMISLSSVAITLTIGLLLINFAHGQGITQRDEIKINQILDALSDGKYNQWQTVIDYCYQYADSLNPVQNLVDKDLLPLEYNGKTCKTVKQTYDHIMNITLNAIYEARINESEINK